ncbi:hypothetical protein BDB01DRAFT_854315 [Pilobolus umbonatus]|nr:hypothetical protein BDB01DRAFT_854315 [Pilobolus umbonatus]
MGDTSFVRGSVVPVISAGTDSSFPNLKVQKPTKQSNLKNTTPPAPIRESLIPTFSKRRHSAIYPTSLVRDHVLRSRTISATDAEPSFPKSVDVSIATPDTSTIADITNIDNPSSPLGDSIFISDIQLTSLKELAPMTKELFLLLSTAQSRIAELESQLIHYTSSVPQNIPKYIVDPPPSTPQPQKHQPKSVSFSDATISAPSSSYASVASTPVLRRRAFVSKKQLELISKSKTLGLQPNRILGKYYSDNKIVGILFNED